MSRSIGMSDFMGKKFDTLAFDGLWKEHLGNPEKNFKMCIWGDSGNGKTDYCVQFTKYLSQFGKVYYNSFEEGVSESLQKAFLRHNMIEVKGKVVLGNQNTFDELMVKLSNRNSPQFVVIDSVDFMYFTKAQYQVMTKRFPNKSFIFISWAKGKMPLTSAAISIMYMSGIKVHVKKYNAFPMSRYGGNEVFNIWDKHKLQPVKQKPEANQPNLFTPQPAAE